MKLSDLKKGSHIHLMGICGTAMASLAGLLKDQGYKITGSDSNPYPPMSTQIESLGIQIMRGYKKENLATKPDFVVVGNVISANNEEVQEVQRLAIPYSSLPSILGEVIIGRRESIVISGTHGKTTTTSMMSWVTTQLGLKPGFLIGGIPKNFSNSFKNPEGNYFVIEGDEYDTAFFDKVPKFIHYRPKHVILTSIEFDHADIYKDLDDVKKAFKTLLRLIPENGTFIYNGDDQNIVSILGECHCKKTFSYGFKGTDYIAKISGSSFAVFFKGESLEDFQIQTPGEYNVLNALAVIALAHQQAWDLTTVRRALGDFLGVKRRQEILGEPRGILVIEDFAHHPTAVRETVKGIKAKYPDRKMYAIFEPRSATSRRKVFQKDYVEAFLGADEVIIAQAFDQTKISDQDRFSSEELVGDLKRSHKSAVCLDSADSIVRDLVQRARPSDLILIMSNGGFDGIYKKLLDSLT